MERKKIVKEPFMEKVKWKRLKIKSSIYAVCTILFVISLVAIIIICCNFSTDSIVYGVGNSLFTGIIASIIVSVIIQIKQDKEQFEKKRAILFDAVFFLKNFQNNYQERKKSDSNIDEDWRGIFDLCEEPARYLSELYQSGLDILDVVDISIIRRINSSYKFILEISKEISVHSKEKKFLKDPKEVTKVWNKYKKEVTELKENLFFLLIKWEKDSIID